MTSVLAVGTVTANQLDVSLAAGRPSADSPVSSPKSGSGYSIGAKRARLLSITS